jgi:hypothetical protein
MHKLKKLRNLIFIIASLVLVVVNISPYIFGEGKYLTYFFVAGWVLLVALSIIYFYGFIKWKDE